MSYDLWNGFQACIHAGSFTDCGYPDRKKVQTKISLSLENTVSELFPHRCSSGYNDSCVPHIQP